MYIRSAFFSFVCFLVTFQSTAELFRRHYEVAEAKRSAGDLAGAELEYKAVLGEAYYKLGRIRAAEHDYKFAVGAFEAAKQYGEGDPQLLIDLAIAYFYSGDYEKAKAPLLTAVAGDAQNVSARHMLGKTYFMLSEFEKASEQLQTALKLSPRDYDVSYTLGLAYLKERKVPEAQQIFARMIEQLGNRPQLHVLIGRGYRETGFLAESIEEFRAAIALDPQFPRVHYYLGLTLLLKDGATKLDDAAEEFKIELNAHPDEFFANYYLGIVHTIKRDWDLAIQFLQKASQIQPKNPDPYFYLGQSYQAQQKHEEAIVVLRKAIELNTDFKHNDYQVTNAHFRLGQSLLKVGRSEEGQSELKIAADLKSKALKSDEARLDAFINPENPSNKNALPELVLAEGLVSEKKSSDTPVNESLKNDAIYYAKVIANAHNNIGLLRAERQDFVEAAKQFSLSVKWNPDAQEINYNLGLAYFKAESYKEAVSPFETELKQNPTNLRAKQLLGLSYFMTEDYSKAATLLGEVLTAKPGEVALYYPLALSLSKAGKFDAVAEVVQKMLAVGGNSPQVHIVLAQAYYEQGATDKALAELKDAQALDRNVLLAHFYTGMIYLRTGKFAEAADQFEAELKLNPADIQARYNLGYVLLANQQTARGIQVMREVISTKPDFANAHFELGKALLQTGNAREAVTNLEIAAKLTPEQAHVHYQLGRAYLALGRKTESDNEMEIYKRLKDSARNQTSP